MGITIYEPPTDDAPHPHDDHPYTNGHAIDIIPPLAREGIIPLGHNRSVFYFFSLSTKQIHALKPAEFTKNNLMMLASVPHYWERTDFKSEKSGIHWDSATDHLMGECRRLGIYDPSRLRGRGAWIDAGRSVLHLGDRLIVDGADSHLMLPDSRHIYEAEQPLAAVHAAPLSTSEAHKLVGFCKAASWQKPISGTLLAGFIAVAPVCGGLAWRPSIWLTGGSNTGKSTLYNNVIAPCLGGLALLCQSKTTEAGIRQALGSDARPVLFDEAEAEDAASAVRIQAVLDLLRQASSEGSAEIIKGTQDQRAAKRFRVRSSFALVSINVSLKHQADESRVTILPLTAIKNPTDPAFAATNREILATITPAYSAGLLSRSVKLLPVIRHNAAVFANAVAIVFGSRRTGDQIGALLAGAYSLHSDRPIEQEAALSWVRSQDWSDDIQGTNVERDEIRLLSHLTQARITISQGNGPSLILTVGRLLDGVRGRDEQLSRDVADRELRQIGIRWMTRDGYDGFWVSNNHPHLVSLMNGTPWSAGHRIALARLPGATVETVNIRFGAGHQSKAVWVPAEAL
jgi:putative DNA primase/helicase